MCDTMRIAICDDEAHFRKQFRERVSKYFIQNNIICQIEEFQTGESFAAVNGRFDLVFMDYLLEDGNGIDHIRQIRDVNPNLLVIFLTVYSEYAIESIRLDTFRYLVKPVPDELLTEALDSFVKLYQYNRKIIVPTGGKTLYIDADDVMYIEADKKYTVVRTVTGQHRSVKGISDYYAEINNAHFFRTHRSYILNMKYISSIDKKTIVLTNGEKVVCSSKNYDEFLKNYMSYLKYES